MSRVRLPLRITLKSDLCPGSGDGFSSGIDRDVCFDQRGLPIIPGRRIKGCLKEAAKLVGFGFVDEVFGTARASVGGSIRVGDAMLCANMQTVEDDPQQTLDRYTMLRASTAIDEVTGSAKKNTLRYTRVVRHRVLGENGYEELVFEAPIEVDEAYAKGLRQAARALRNMGLSRNRGLGAVRCELGNLQGSQGGSKAPDRGGDAVEFAGQSFADEDGDVRLVAISYVVELKTPVMVPRANALRSVGYVPGSSVYGFFAERLSDCEDFERIFLQEGVRFSPLYPVSEEGDRCLSAPSFIIKVKGGADNGAYKNGLGYVCDPNASAKPLRDEFVSPRSWLPVDVATEIVYHHSQEGEGELYTQQCLSAGQKLAGYIECPEDLADRLRSVLCSRELSFGRSKSAQYSVCEAKEADRDFSGRCDKVHVVPGKKYAVLLDSDLLLMEEGRFTTDFEALKNALVDACGTWLGTVDVDEAFSSDSEDATQLVTSIRTCTISGYNAKWNQKKSHVQAFAAGSTVVFTADKDAKEQDVSQVRYVGERQAEGFGCIRIISLEDVRVEERDTSDADVEAQRDRPVTQSECMRQRVVQCVEVQKKISSSFVGRFALMVRESASEAMLRERLQSIKDEDKRSGAIEILNRVRQNTGEGVAWSLLQECLTLYLDLLKYRLKRAEGNRGGAAQ